MFKLLTGYALGLFLSSVLYNTNLNSKRLVEPYQNQKTLTKKQQDSLDYFKIRDSLNSGYGISLRYSDLLGYLDNNIDYITDSVRDSLNKVVWFKINSPTLYSPNNKYYDFQPEEFRRSYKIVVVSLIFTENYTDGISKEKVSLSFDQMLKYSGEKSVARGMYHELLAFYLSHWLKEYDNAAHHYSIAAEIYEQYPIWYEYSGIKSIDLGTGLNYLANKQYEKAVPYLKKHIARDTVKSVQITSLKWLTESYEKINKIDSAYFFLKKTIALRNLELKELKKNGTTPNLGNQASLLKAYNNINRLRNRYIFVFLIMVTISIVLIIVFVRYKKYLNKSRSLKIEKFETLQKLDELKNIVIKNHVVLKDKTKIYSSDLIYLKSDDHYLNIFTSNGKNHFVRGKLSKIKEELPPNFIQCHRSFIVNSNFIKQINKDYLVLMNKEIIPLSRSFKKNF
ncbi:LytTR family DNA-binding domain-containing protein [Spongiivirga sp. MCCC 1A20706]|uniref:LytTR family transcriptional regulator DNA-binding domain-containing protein n=1 Tax=Spongiivirga sp. MCCC 1A20706 TaxID=3160963 RepID=UPI0039772D8C